MYFLEDFFCFAFLPLSGLQSVFGLCPRGFLKETRPSARALSVEVCALLSECAGWRWARCAPPTPRQQPRPTSDTRSTTHADARQGPYGPARRAHRHLRRRSKLSIPAKPNSRQRQRAAASEHLLPVPPARCLRLPDQPLPGLQAPRSRNARSRRLRAVFVRRHSSTTSRAMRFKPSYADLFESIWASALWSPCSHVSYLRRDWAVPPGCCWRRLPQVAAGLGRLPARRSARLLPRTRADYAKGLSGVFEGSHLFHGVHAVNHLTTIAGFAACKHNLDALVKARAKVAEPTAYDAPACDGTPRCRFLRVLSISLRESRANYHRHGVTLTRRRASSALRLPRLLLRR